MFRTQSHFFLLAFYCALLGSARAENIVYPPGLTAVIDVTQAPYFADATGRTDSTGAINRAIDDVMRPQRDALHDTMRTVRERLAPVHRVTELDFDARQRLLRENPAAVIGMENTGGTFPRRNLPARILYFPNGTYLVSDTLSYSFTDLQNASGMEFNQSLHFQGQSEAGVIIRLRDEALGFGPAAARPVLSFMQGEKSNVAMQNTCENLTIDTGRGNPGAVALRFFANNTGAVRHVTLRSGDPEARGRAGLSMTTYNSSCVLVQHVTVEGFDLGVEIGSHRLYTVLEHVALRGQRVAGLHLTDHNLAARRLVSRNRVPAVVIEGAPATLALIDCEFTGGDAQTAAIEHRAGALFARNIVTSGYVAALRQPGGDALAGPRIDEYTTTPTQAIFAGAGALRSLNLPVEETPAIPWETDFTRWAGVEEFGAKGDGFADDTAAIQAAMDSGRPVVYFGSGRYLINAPITVPAHVQRVNFMYADLVAGGDLQRRAGEGAFRLTGESSAPLLVEKLFAFELWFGAHTLLDHASTRTVVLRDLHTQIGAMYRNSVPGGKVFIENVCSTDPFEPDLNCFRFEGQQVWARQLNPERANPEVLNLGSRLWVLGFKTEKYGTAFQTEAGGATELLGGIFNISRSAESPPTLIVRDAALSVFAGTTDHRQVPASFRQRPVLSATLGEETRLLRWDEFPPRDENLVVVSLRVGTADSTLKTASHSSP